MKWLFVFLAVCFMVAPAMAGEDPYISIVGPDYLGNPFYFSPKHFQFMYNENADPFFIPVTFGSFPPVSQYTRVGLAGQEQFRSQTLNSLPEVCRLLPVVAPEAPAAPPITLLNAKTPAGNAGFYEWFI